jgi:hypothetical protein
VSDPRSLTVRVQALDGQWETLGGDRYRAVVPEGVTFSFNASGPDMCSFTLRRDTGATHPDLTTWTPIEVEVAGRVVWDGRLKETPTSDGDDPAIAVQAEGWQYHLDDDVYSYSYAHTRLSFVDTRSYVSAALATNIQVYNVTAGDGQLLVGVTNQDTMVANTAGSAVVDLGPGCSAVTVSIDVSSSFNTAGFGLYVMGTDVPSWTDASRLDFVSGLAMNDASFVSAGTTQTITATIASPRRYITVLMYSGATAGVMGGDYWFRVTGLRCFASASYQTAGVSTLKADTVIKHAVATAAPLLSTDTSQIAAGTFAIPEFALDGQHSPREVLSAVNAYENYELRVAVGRRLYFQPRQAAPAYEIGEWSGADFSDASMNSGDDIYNRAIVEGTGPDGSALSVERYQTGRTTTSGVAQPANPSADVNTANWTTTTSSFVRNTTTFHSSPASFRHGGDGFMATSSVAQPFIKGQRYRMSFWALSAFPPFGFFTTTGFPLYYRVEVDGVVVGNYSAGISTGSSGWAFGYYTDAFWTLLTFEWAQTFTGSAYVIRLWENQSAGFIDDFVLERHVETLVDRRSFVRTKILPVSSSITNASGGRIGDLYLAAHRTVPFKGGFQAVGLGGVRRTLGGASVHPAHIEPGRVVRCAHRVNPDTGGWGRDGTIATVTYSHDSLTSSVALDENRAGLESLLGRLSVVQNQPR